MQSTTITVTNAEGLHARPAHLFVSTAGKYAAKVQVRSLTGESEYVNGQGHPQRAHPGSETGP